MSDDAKPAPTPRGGGAGLSPVIVLIMLRSSYKPDYSYKDPHQPASHEQIG
jgi:hypothetical protein